MGRSTCRSSIPKTDGRLAGYGQFSMQSRGRPAGNHQTTASRPKRHARRVDLWIVVDFIRVLDYLWKACAVKKLGGGPGTTRGSNLPGCPIVLLGLLYSVFRLLLDALIDRRRSDASLRLELLVLRHQVRVLERQVKQPRWRSADRLTLAGLSRRLPRPTWVWFLVGPKTHARPRLGRPVSPPSAASSSCAWLARSFLT